MDQEHPEDSAAAASAGPGAGVGPFIDQSVIEAFCFAVGPGQSGSVKRRVSCHAVQTQPPVCPVAVNHSGRR